jgi:hypothetical protein
LLNRVELPAQFHCDVTAYVEMLCARPASPPPIPADPVRFIVAMLEPFIATDLGFAKARRKGNAFPG